MYEHFLNIISTPTAFAHLHSPTPSAPHLQLFDVEAQLVESFVAGRLNAQVDHGVGEGAAHIVLQRQVVHALGGEVLVSNTVLGVGEGAAHVVLQRQVVDALWGKVLVSTAVLVGLVRERPM